MNKILKTVSAFLLALSLAAMPMTAQTNHNGGRQSHFSSSQSNGAGHRPRPSSGGNSGSHNQGQSRPSNNGSSSRPGNSNSGHRPGGTSPSRPGDNNSGSHRPGNSHRPGHNNGSHRPPSGGNNGHKPGGSHTGTHRPGTHPVKPGRPSRPTPPPRPSRPHRPVYFGSGHHNHHVPFFGNYRRPAPPPSWRPVAYGPSFGTILGIALGTTVDMTLRTLINQGYSVTSYGNNVVYLTNVPQMNYYWPDAALYYNNGVLCGSSFTYPTSYYDMSRYNALYNTFCNQYGMPVSSVNQGGVISSTWFGAGNRYVTLEFNSTYGDYYTTISFGM